MSAIKNKKKPPVFALLRASFFLSTWTCYFFSPTGIIAYADQEINMQVILKHSETNKKSKLFPWFMPRNCELFYMSVNPCNTAMKSTRKESEIRGFNNRLRQRLNGNFTWINSYSYLMRCGYTTRCEFRGYTDDGVHYSMRTYKRIYAYAIKQIR